MVQSDSQTGQFLGWIESLTDPTRLRLLRLVERQALGVAELCDVLQMPQSTVSRHLKLLTEKGWTNCCRQGTTRLYRLMVNELDPAVRRLWVLVRQQTDHWAQVGQDQLRLAQRLEQRRSESQTFFASAAAKWDKLRVELYGHSFVTEALAALLPSDWTIADLGCGTGQLAVQLAQSVRRVICVDHSAAMLKAARRRTSFLDNVELRRGDLEALPIDDASCDAAVLMLVLTYVPQPTVALREAVRILRPGGSVVVVDLLHHDRETFRQRMGQQFCGFELLEVEKWFHEADLVRVRCRSLAPASQVTGPALMLATANRPTQVFSHSHDGPFVTVPS